MIEGGECPRLPLKPFETLGILRNGGWQDFERDVASELRVGGAIHLAHPAFAELLQDLIVTNTWPVISSPLAVLRRTFADARAGSDRERGRGRVARQPAGLDRVNEA